MQLEITPEATKQLISAGIGQDSYLRLLVVPGGCAGMSYDMVLEDTLRDDDKVVFEQGVVKVVTDPASAPYLDGLKIDYSDDLVESGYRLSNPNATRSCGCGSSFSCG